MGTSKRISITKHQTHWRLLFVLVWWTIQSEQRQGEHIPFTVLQQDHSLILQGFSFMLSPLEPIWLARYPSIKVEQRQYCNKFCVVVGTLVYRLTHDKGNGFAILSASVS